MCGIFGYVGQPTEIMPIVANALRTMEYRGYDSWGIGWDAGAGIEVLKRTGRVPQQVPTAGVAPMAIGHTRWATHGGVTDVNAHPHLDQDGRIAVVHNGVIENARELTKRYLADLEIASDTDSAIVPCLIRRFMDGGESFASAVRTTFLLLEGSSAILAADQESGTVAAITSRSPLRLGRREGGWELASDPLALAAVTDEIVVIPDHHLVVLTADTAAMLNAQTGSETSLKWQPAPREIRTHRGHHPHFTIKEIHDQPEVFETLQDDRAAADHLREMIDHHRHVILTGCGSAFYAASAGAVWLTDETNAWIDVIPASEITAHTRNLGSETLVIALTQSGETADVVDALHVAKAWGAGTAAIVNTESSTVARMVDHALPLRAGVERSVLATKSFFAMVQRLAQVARVSMNAREDVQDALLHTLDTKVVERIVDRLEDATTVLSLGKGVGRAMAHEAALKIKEGAYVHAEAFLTGELKHGPLALVQEGTPCFIFATTAEETDAAKIAAREVMSRGGYVIGIGAFGDDDCSLPVPIAIDGELACLSMVIIAQRVAYSLAVRRGIDPDFPRNLAKSVTVR